MSKLTKLGRRYLILACFFLVVESLAYTLCVYYTASILQHAQDGSLPEMLKSAVIAIALLAVKFVEAFAARSANLKFLSDGTIRMRNDIMKSIFSRPFYLFRKQNDAYYLTALAQRVGNTPLGDFGDNISGGERQRINIARAMRRHPRIMVFDEPTTGLDPENVNLINEFIFDHTDMLRIVIGHNRDSEYLKRFDDVIHIGK